MQQQEEASHFCFSYDKQAKSVTIVYKGEKVFVSETYFLHLLSAIRQTLLPAEPRPAAYEVFNIQVGPGRTPSDRLLHDREHKHRLFLTGFNGSDSRFPVAFSFVCNAWTLVARPYYDRTERKNWCSNFSNHFLEYASARLKKTESFEELEELEQLTSQQLRKLLRNYLKGIPNIRNYSLLKTARSLLPGQDDSLLPESTGIPHTYGARFPDFKRAEQFQRLNEQLHSLVQLNHQVSAQVVQDWGSQHQEFAAYSKQLTQTVDSLRTLIHNCPESAVFELNQRCLVHIKKDRLQHQVVDSAREFAANLGVTLNAQVVHSPESSPSAPSSPVRTADDILAEHAQERAEKAGPELTPY